jgi:hypothetical protein
MIFVMSVFISCVVIVIHYNIDTVHAGIPINRDPR